MSSQLNTPSHTHLPPPTHNPQIIYHNPPQHQTPTPHRPTPTEDQETPQQIHTHTNPIPPGQAGVPAHRGAEGLARNPRWDRTAEGEASERGTRRYTRGIGARRSNSVRRYLIGQGVDANRLRAVTFGKERPAALCSAAGYWAQHRRRVRLPPVAPSS